MYTYSLKSAEIISRETVLNAATADPIDSSNRLQVARKNICDLICLILLLLVSRKKFGSCW